MPQLPPLAAGRLHDHCHLLGMTRCRLPSRMVRPLPWSLRSLTGSVRPLVVKAFRFGDELEGLHHRDLW